MLGMLFILAKRGKINSLEVAHIQGYLNASDISMQGAKSSKLQIFLISLLDLQKYEQGSIPAGWGLLCLLYQAAAVS